MARWWETSGWLPPTCATISQTHFSPLINCSTMLGRVELQKALKKAVKAAIEAASAPAWRALAMLPPRVRISVATSLH